MRTKHTSLRIRSQRRHQLALALVAALAAPAALAQSLPQGGTVVNGTASIGTAGTQMTINQSTRGAIIDWGSFSIGSGYGVTFNQPGNGVTLNRVIGFGYGISASTINGALSSTGSVFLINTAGITFGGGASINVGGLIASTIDMSNADFIAGLASSNYTFNAGGSTADVTNYADINAAAGGTVAFLGQSISNYGDISAPGGTVAFGAANGATVTLDPFGDGLTQLTIVQPAAAGEGQIRNYYNTTSADGGQIIMRAANAAGGAAASIVSTGTLRAQSIASRGGRIELTAPGGSVLIGGFPDGFESGVIDASGGGFAGGSVVISAAAVGLLADPFNPADVSRIDASGVAGGGSVDIRATDGIVLYEGTSINANAQAGPGGSIFISAANTLGAFGSLSARGGSAGGSITTATGGDFDIRGLIVDAGSNGTAGSWTLWAPNIDVVDGADAGTVATATPGDEVQDADINQALDTGTSVTLRAGVAPSDNGNIYFGAGVDIFYDDGTVPLQFRADANGDIAGDDFSIGSNGAALSMAFNSDASNLNNGFAGIRFSGATLDSRGGDIQFYGQSDTAGGFASSYDTGVELVGSTITTGGGNVLIRGASTGGDAGSDDAGVVLDGTSVDAGTGAVAIHGTGAGVTSGVILGASPISAGAGGVLIDGRSVEADGLYAFGSNIVANGGAISLTGIGIAHGVYFDGDLASGGGAISIDGDGTGVGVLLQGNVVDGGGGDIDVNGVASGANGFGVELLGAQLLGTTGDVTVFGNAVAGTGVNFAGQSGISTTTGAIGVTGIGQTVGLALAGGQLTTQSGHFDLRGRGTGAASDGLVIGQGVSLATNGGGIELSGEGGSGAGVSLGARSSVDAGNSLVVIRAGNDGSSDAIRIGGTISSGMAVNLRPGGVDTDGELTERVDDDILVGGGSTGFALSGAELALVGTPSLLIGSNLQAGAIQVLGGITRNGNLTLQNDGGSGGISIEAPLDVGSGVLALSSGGDITQSSAGAITARSLLARAGGDVLLATASNNVAANTLAGSAGGDFDYQDVDALAIGSVSALGFDATANNLSSVGAAGISAGGDVFVRNLAGNLVLNGNVSGVNIDLVTANTLQNLGGASLVASGDWRVWANTWVGEARGGLAGDGSLPNLYGCAYLGQCGVTVPVADSHFIYVQQPTALVTFDSFSREYGLPNPVFTFTVGGAILGDSAANVASGTGTTTATIGSNVGSYAITGNFTSSAGYQIRFVPGTLAITPATLVFTADNFVRYLGTENPLFTGSVTGFRNGDTVQSVFGNGVIWSSPAGLLSPIGFYPINGGTSATNYVFVQAPGNATALQIIPLPQLSSTPIDLIRETVNTYVYDRNFGGAPMCAVNASLDDQQLASLGDELSNEWSKVRSRPNLTNCFETERKNSCGDF
jgi:filamentous hemagglutinin family protein